MNKKPEALYLNDAMKARTFPPGRKYIEMRWEETPLFKSFMDAEANARQPGLFDTTDSDRTPGEGDNTK